MLKNIFTKEIMTNAVVTLVVVMVGLAVHDRFVAPRLKGSEGNDALPTPPVTEDGE